MKRSAQATWRGDGMSGVGALSTVSGAFDHQPYTFKSRFISEDGRAGTNPEELIAAAHAGCFAMALAFALTAAGFPPLELQCESEVEMRSQDGQFTITGIALNVAARVPGIEESEFYALALSAKETCPVSKALAGTPITLRAELIS